ncbi:hypothetical protein MUY22_43030 [Amycolatopsis sp. WQ 127309]|nr:hypothetical protein MUY22_43030 [Amycolatopsis sp. WQ 127309]
MEKAPREARIDAFVPAPAAARRELPALTEATPVTRDSTYVRATAESSIVA